MSCTVNVRQTGPVTVVELAGKFTLGDAPGLIRGTITRLLDDGRKCILMDLSKVTYLDSAAGIGELVSSYTSALRHGARLQLLRPDKNVDHVLRIVGLHTVFDIFDDEQSAIRSFSESEACVEPPR